MTYDIYRYIFIGAAVLCGIMLVLSVVIFFALKIPKVISDLTGATARKAIKNIREQNEASGDKIYKASAFNQARGKLTDKISPSGRIVQQSSNTMGFGVGTTKIETQQLLDEQPANETTVLANETTVLANETTVLSADGTTVLSNEAPRGETTVLDEVQNQAEFTIEYEITFIHTDEIITTEAI